MYPHHARASVGLFPSLVFTAALLVASASARAADPAAPAAGPMIDEQTRAAIARGLEWLGRQQDETGRIAAASLLAYEPVSTSLAGLAFLSAGARPGADTPYSPQLRKALDFVLACQRENGLFRDAPKGKKQPEAPAAHAMMYTHGYATLFLAEAYAASDDAALRDRIRPALEKALIVLTCTQNKQGGWRYQPVPMDADVSATTCQAMALLAAQRAGVWVDEPTLEAAVKYVQSCQNKDGGFGYMPDQAGGSGPARSAAALAVLSYADAAKEKTDPAAAYLRQFTPPGTEGHGHYSYLQYYAARALAKRGDEEWTKWYGAASRDLVRRQDRPSGKWMGDGSDTYSTAMALIVLQMPDRRLPTAAPTTRPAGK